MLVRLAQTRLAFPRLITVVSGGPLFRKVAQASSYF